MAYPSENPVLAANLQFILHRNRGSEMAVESLRMALLGIAAVHQSFLLSRQGVCNGEGGADDCMQLAYSFRTKAKHSLYAACNTVDGARDDATLAAATGIILIDVSDVLRRVTVCLAQPLSDLLWWAGLGQNIDTSENIGEHARWPGGPASSQSTV